MRNRRLELVVVSHPAGEQSSGHQSDDPHNGPARPVMLPAGTSNRGQFLDLVAGALNQAGQGVGGRLRSVSQGTRHISSLSGRVPMMYPTSRRFIHNEPIAMIDSVIDCSFEGARNHVHDVGIITHR
jgi:hypothetical protein